MSKFTNTHGIALPVAVWLADETYDHVTGVENYISATTLLRPVRATVLAKRIKPEDMPPTDISRLVASSMGTAIHDSIERAWVERSRENLFKLGYPDWVIDRIKINPDPATVDPEHDIPVYFEKRTIKQIGKHHVGGKFDNVAEGKVRDFKSTSVFVYTKGVKDDDYSLQGSIYRYLNPDIITEDTMEVHFILTDWSRAQATQNPDYPQTACPSRNVPLKSIPETEQWIKGRLDLIETCMDLPQDELPRCTDKELWRGASTYKYYKNPEKMTRATKNFDTFAEANLRLAEDGYVGVVREVKAPVVACNYCPAFSACKQKDEYLESGDLVAL